MWCIDETIDKVLEKVDELKDKYAEQGFDLVFSFGSVEGDGSGDCEDFSIVVE